MQSTSSALEGRELIRRDKRGRVWTKPERRDARAGLAERSLRPRGLTCIFHIPSGDWGGGVEAIEAGSEWCSLGFRLDEERRPPTPLFFGAGDSTSDCSSRIQAREDLGKELLDSKRHVTRLLTAS